MKKLVSLFLCFIFLLFFTTYADEIKSEVNIMERPLKFDFGSKETPGYISVPANLLFSQDRGYGFSKETKGEVVSQGRSDSLFGDGVNLGDATFDVILPDGNYRFVITKASTKRAIIYINNMLAGMNVDMYGTENIPYGSTIKADLPITGGKASLRMENTSEIAALEIYRISDTEKRKPHIFLIGDSTVCDYYPIKNYNPQPGTVRTGWGQLLGGFLDPNFVVVKNMAASGTYARQYYEAGWFDGVINQAKEGDYIFIQYGINDRTYDNIDSMKATLKKMVEKSVEKKLIPVLISPQISVKFWGIQTDFGRPTGSGFAGFFKAVGEVANETGTLFIDLTSLSSEFFGTVGRVYTSKNYYLYDKNKDEQVDGLHLSYHGAKRVAEIVVEEIKRQKSEGIKDKWGNDFSKIVVNEEAPYRIFYQGQSGLEEMDVIATKYKFVAGNTSIFIAGDSTAQSYGDHYYPQKGWGQFIHKYLDESITIKNHALAGRSAKTFDNEGRFEAILKDLKAGDYVFIQFGHNDRSTSKPERYSTPQEFETLLTKFATQTMQKGGNPVILTPTTSNWPNEKGEFGYGFGDYTKAMENVARNLNIPILDVNKATAEYFTSVGPQEVKSYFLNCEAGEAVNYPDGVTDNTHFKDKGADKVAYIVATEIKNKIPALSGNVILPNFDKEYADLENHWAKDYVKSLTKEGILDIINSDNFMPDELITRLDFAVLILKAANMSGHFIKDIQFKDITNDNPYKFFAQTIKDLNLFDENMIVDNKLMPQSSITREEAACLISNVLKHLGVKAQNLVDINSYMDKDEISPWAKDYMANVVSLNIISGTGQNMLSPKKVLTKAEAVVMASRLRHIIKGER